MRLTRLGIPLLCLVAAGCGMEKDKGIFMAAGSYGDLAVVYSEDGLEPLARDFESRLGDLTTFVIKAEPRFNTDLYPAGKWELARGYKNAVFLVHLGQGGEAEKAVRGLLSAEAWDQLGTGQGGMVQRHDPWSTYQLLVVVASRDRNSLSSLLRQNMDRIRDTIENSNRERIQRRNRYDGLETRLMNVYWERFGFYLEIPATYRQNQLDTGVHPGIELMQNSPSRGITITWEAVDDPVGVLEDPEFLIGMRRAIGERLHDEELPEESLMWDEGGLPGVGGKKLTGSWTSTSFAGGGPFWCYFIADPAGRRVFCIDLLVYAPGMDKMGFFRRMEAVAATFALERPQP
ncbi:MAG: DUF4837 family protein [Candidatus Krumholzibacteriia bacterium]